MPILRPRVKGGDVVAQNGRIAASAGSDKDSALSAITKWIPIEVIAFYEGVTKPFGDAIASGLPYGILVGAIVTFLWIAFATASARIAWRQVILATMAIVFWVVGTTSPDIWKMLLPWWVGGINPAVLATGAVALPITDGILRRLGIPQD